MTTFATFRAGPGGEICRRIGLDVSGLTDWRDYTAAVAALAGRDNGLVAAVRSACLSSGERAVLAAALHAADYSWLADEVDDGRTWRRLDNTHDAFAMAVAACILRVD